MPKYSVVFKCNLCGGITYSQPQEAEEKDLPELASKVIKKQMLLGNPYLYETPMHMVHNCSDGSAGIAVFSGFKFVD